MVLRLAFVHGRPRYSFFSRTHRVRLVLSLPLQLASMNSFWILKCTSKIWEFTHACVVKYIRAWLPCQPPRGGLASQTLTCMGTLKTSSADKPLLLLSRTLRSSFLNYARILSTFFLTKHKSASGIFSLVNCTSKS